MTSPFAKPPANWRKTPIAPRVSTAPADPVPAPASALVGPALTGPPSSADAPDRTRAGRGAPRNLFVEQARNRRITWFLVSAFVALLAFLGFGVDVFVLGLGRGTTPFDVPRTAWPVAAPIALAVGVVSAWSGYRYGDRAVLRACGARPVTAGDPSTQVLRNAVAEMAIAAGLPEPGLYVVADADPNAFATGRDPAHASIAVTEGLVRLMNRDELQGVIAHEMAHIRNYDVRTMTVIAALLGAVLLVSEAVTRDRHGRRRQPGRGSGIGGGAGAIFFVLWILAIVLAPLLGQVLAMAVSRNREYLADASAAELTRNPAGLASALEKLEAAVAPTVRIARGTAHLCIVDPLGRRLNDRQGLVADLFATHPPIRSRVERLNQMAFAV